MSLHDASVNSPRVLRPPTIAPTWSCDVCSLCCFRIEPDPDTTSSLFDDSDVSLPQSPVSDNNLQTRHLDTLAPYTPLRVARSAEVLTPTARRKFFYPENKGSEKTRRKSDLERPQFHLVIENSPSPPEVRKTPRMSRSDRQTLPRENSSPEIYITRPHSVHMERPHSEIYTTANTLPIPSPDFMRLCSESYRSNSSLNTHPSRSDSFSRDQERKPTSSPRVTSSIQRPLNFNRATPEGENEWQKDRWRQWDNVTSQKGGDVFEQETLVWEQEVV